MVQIKFNRSDNENVGYERMHIQLYCKLLTRGGTSVERATNIKNYRRFMCIFRTK